MSKIDQRKQPLQDVRVLVLDDDAAIRRLIQSALCEPGYNVEPAADGREALQIILQYDFDVLIVDLKMREMDGIAFLQEALNIWPWMGVVIITGYADSASVLEANALGITRILSKPLQIDVLRQNVMEEALAKRQRVDLTSGGERHPVQYQLGVLRQITESAIVAETLVDALRSLSTGLAQSLPCAVVAVLGLEAEERVLFVSVREPVASQFLDGVEREICRRYEMLTHQDLSFESLRIEVEGVARDKRGPSEPGSVFSVPVMSGGEIHGLITVAASSDEAYERADVSFLYHAANHLSTVFLAFSRMRQLAIRDPLTGLFNRRFMEEELERTWLLSQRHDQMLCVVIIDIDQFKVLNDTFGHPVGDQALCDFADLLRKVSRGTDIIARYGGDEVVVVLPQTDTGEARVFCDRLLEEVRATVFCHAQHPMHLTVSIGVAANRSSSPPKDRTELLAQADKALYAAKKAGRDQVCFWATGLEKPESEPGTADEDETVAASLPRPVSSGPAPADKGGILIVDDDPTVRKLLLTLLKEEGYEVTADSSVPDAIRTLRGKKREIEIVITDLEMPHKSGLDLLEELRQADESLIKIVVSGHATADNAIACLRKGAYDFIEKPINPDQLIAVIERACEYLRLLKENERYRNYLEEMVNEKSAALAATYEELKKSYEFTLEAMVALLDARETTTGSHSVRVREIACVVARKLGVSGEELEDISHGALLHDIGKIGIPDAVLLKPGPLTPEEWAIMKQHPEIGYNIIRSSPFLLRASEIVLSHQEKFDGSGYPRGLKGHDICLGARIFAIGDAYDAMRSDRLYRKALSRGEAEKEIKRCRGTHFDPAIVDAFLACLDEIESVCEWDRRKSPAATSLYSSVR